MYNLTGDVKTKLGHHNGVFTRSYQEARAIFDAKIRSWEISHSLEDKLFFVTNSDKETYSVYFDFKIQNCSCPEFVEIQSGTCMHLEAVKLLVPSQISYSSLGEIRPIVYLDREFNIKLAKSKTTTAELNDTFRAPGVENFVRYKEINSIPNDNFEINDFEIFKDFGITLFDFQKQSIQQMLNRRKTVLVLQMGLGKTICALAASKHLNKKKILIVAPNSLKLQWDKEINRFQIGTCLVAHKSTDLKKYHDQQFLVMSYELLNNNRDLLEQKFDIVIADEIQKIKNKESETWKTISKVKSEYVFALSGTPIQNTITDLLSLIDFLNPKELKPEWKFYEEYCDCTRSRILGIKPHKKDELRGRIGPYLINPKIDFSKFKMPEKKEFLVLSKLTEQQKNIHDDLFEGAKILIAKGMNYPLTFGERMALNVMLTKCRMAATDARLLDPKAEVSDRLQKVFEKIVEVTSLKRKIVVYSEWIKALNLLRAPLQEVGIDYTEFTGELSPKKRNKNLERFIEDPSCMVFLSTDSGGLGIDGLQFAASDLIHLEKIWNPMKLAQRNGRLVRALQKQETVQVYTFLSDSGIEAMMMSNHDRKHGVIAEMLNS